MYNTYVIDVDGVKLGYFPSCLLMFPASRRKMLAVVVSRCSFPPGFTGHGGAKRSDAVRLVRRAVNVDGNPSGMEDGCRSCKWHRRSEIYRCGRSRGRSSWYPENERRNYRLAWRPDAARFGCLRHLPYCLYITAFLRDSGSIYSTVKLARSPFPYCAIRH